MNDTTRIEELSSKLGRKRQRRTSATWPGGTLAIELRVLSSAEIDECRGRASDVIGKRYTHVVDTPAASAFASKILGAHGTQEVLQGLALAIERETGLPMFESAKELAEVADEDEVAALWELYEDLVAEAAPSPTPDEERQRKFVDAIRRGDVAAAVTLAELLPRSVLSQAVSGVCDVLREIQASAAASSSEQGKG